MLKELQSVLVKPSGIYKLVWPLQGYYYIGQSYDMVKRYKKHLRRLNRQAHENNRVQNIYNKYGPPDMEVLIYSAIEDLDKLEQEFLDLHFGLTLCCNLCPTASSTKGYKHTEESRRKIGELSKQKVFSEEYRAKLRTRTPNKTMLGRKHTEETRRKMSQAGKGRKKTQEHAAKIGAAVRGEKHYLYGKSLPEETKQKLSEAFSREKNHKAKRVIDTRTGEIFACLKDAAESCDINYSTAKSRAQRRIGFLQYQSVV